VNFFEWVARILIGNGNNQYEQDHATQGRHKKDKARSERAKASHKPATAKKQRAAEQMEKELVRKYLPEGIHQESVERNAPTDVNWQKSAGSQIHGFEVKTATDQENDKLTMNKKSRLRKLDRAAEMKWTLHTIAFDIRDKMGYPKLYLGHRVYYRSGVGSYRLHKMTPVNSREHLLSLIKRNS
jgi:hypothetical protein